MKKMKNPPISKERLHELVEYDSMTGHFTWKINKGRVLAGSLAGNKTTHGYIEIVLDRHRYYAHRLVWFYLYGLWPKNEIDHINGSNETKKFGAVS